MTGIDLRQILPIIQRTSTTNLPDMKSAQLHIGLAKLYVCASTALTLWLGLAHIDNGDTWADLVVLLSTLPLVVLGMMDAAVNDLMPARYHAKAALKWRYLVFVGMAGSQTAWMYSDVVAGALGSSTVRYALDAAVAAGVAVLDIRLRFQQARLRNLIHADRTEAPA